MNYTAKPGDGTLFVNNYKDADNKPDRTGYVIAHRDIKAGEKVALAGWIKGGSEGRDPFLSLRMSDVRGREESPEPAPEPAPDDSTIPF